MFDYQGPVAAADKLADFRDDHGSALPADRNQKLREILRQGGYPPRVMQGMELLYAVAIEQAPEASEVQTALAQTIGELATAWGMGQWISPEKTDRAWAMQAWAAHQITPGPVDPSVPAVDPEYTSIVPDPIIPAPEPEPEPEPEPAPV